MRTSAEINQEYSSVAAQLGHLEFQIAFVIPEQQKELAFKMRALNKEADEAARNEKSNVQA